MSHISERDFRGVDLNLLVTLLVLLREKSVSRAAACLHLGQPAVSGALARLRELFRDDLLVRSKGGMQPTPRAEHLQALLVPLLAGLQAVVTDAPAFDPRAASRSVVLGMPDWVDTWLLSSLVAALAEQAPGVRLTVAAADRFNVQDMLARGELDLAVGAFDAGPAWLRRHVLCAMGYCCVGRPGVVPRKGVVSLRRFTALPHLMVTYRGVFQGTVDEALAREGLARQVICTSPRFSSLPRMLQAMDAIATVPEALAEPWRRDFGLESAPTPLPLPGIEVSLVHHANRDNDPLLQWLCGVVAAVASPPGGARKPVRKPMRKPARKTAPAAVSR